MRNRFAVGDTLEVLSPTDTFGRTFTVTEIENSAHESVQVADKVQERVKLRTGMCLEKYDILRRSCRT